VKIREIREQAVFGLNTLSDPDETGLPVSGRGRQRVRRLRNDRVALDVAYE
jgi:hypothetical protein